MLWIRIRIELGRLDPDPNPGGKKLPSKIEFEKWRNFMFRRAACSLLSAEGYFWGLDAFHGSMGINKLKFFKIKNRIFFSCKISQNLVIKILDPDPHGIRCGSPTLRGNLVSEEAYTFLAVVSLSPPAFKGTVAWDGFPQCWWKLTDPGLIKCRGWFLNFSEAPLI